MIFLLPILVIVGIIVAIDYLYFPDVKQHDTSSKEVHRSFHDTNATKEYLDRYIKK